MVLVVSLGVGAMVMVGFWRLVKRVRLRTVLWIAYGVIFSLALFNSPEFHAFAFDASGSTTGAITTPFLLALAAGIAGLYEGEAEDTAWSVWLPPGPFWRCCCKELSTLQRLIKRLG